MSSETKQDQSNNRRGFLKKIGLSVGAFAVAGVGTGTYFWRAGDEATANDQGDFEISRTPEEWKNILTENEYKVLREEQTERAYTSDLLEEKREGIYHCAGCDQAVYPSETKYDSGTGWPSFWAPVDEAAIGTKPDNKLFMTRTEVHCSRCGGHLGHIFDDGPKPTGKRHCLNGIALNFKAA
ncbi:peptide-methionine (R)-S-oxide reductase [Maritalea mobilis]|uniref:peptide-methionine (R)-S-oxide reductase n=1 Tax=Maritalea mobilis TaxID=483324 RepID=A0A4R6VGW6_9HYPH|nr:peptide-methionine (R)-S-oxide reductase MsrB [Maritalea mobilis]TDQ61813.1 peptide-methionine (R)-S-oxide reductase [Maritalea mobilis]